MKIVDENGVELNGEPDLTLGRLVDDAEIVHHEATHAVEKVSHWVTTRTYPNGSRDVEEVVDVEPVAAKDAWDETVPIQRYIKYTQDELDEQARQQEHDTKMAQMPETVEQLKAENDALRKSFTTMESAQNDTDSLMVDQEYRLTLLELGITE